MNNSQFNQDLFNQDHSYNTDSGYSISFNGYNLMSISCQYIQETMTIESTLQDVYGDNILDVFGNQLSVTELQRVIYLKANMNTGIMVQTFNAYDISNIDLTSFTSSQSDGGGIINKKYGNKTLEMTLFIQGSSFNDLVSRIDDLKKNIQGIEGNLDILVQGKIRRYTATVASIVIPRLRKNADYVEGVEISFVITSPHWSDPETDQVFVQGMTGNFTKVVENKGTYKVYPKVQIITNPGSTLSAISVNHKKLGDATGYTLTATTSIPNNAVVVFDYVNKVVTVNGTEVNFSGVMMPMEIGQSVFSFTFTGSVNVNTYILHNPTYL